jgi:hypothetical protein
LAKPDRAVGARAAASRATRGRRFMGTLLNSATVGRPANLVND